MQISLRVFVFFLPLVTLSLSVLRGQRPNSSDVSIITPSQGAVVRPGETLHIKVFIANGVKVEGLCILSEMGYGENLSKTTPDEFTLKIPTDDPNINGPLIGPQAITAFGNIVGREAKSLASTTLDVERGDLPLDLSVDVSQSAIATPEIVFSSEGEVSQVWIKGRFADGKVLSLRQSSHLTLTSSNPSVATVDEQGSVVAIAPGNTSILAAYATEAGTVQVTVPVSVRNLALIASPPSLEFGEQPVSTRSAPMRLTLKNKTNSRMRVFTPEIEGDFEESDDCTSNPISPNGGTCTITLIFTPHEASSGSGRLIIKNDFNEAFTIVDLFGISK